MAEEEEQENAKDGRRVGKEVVIDRAHNNLIKRGCLTLHERSQQVLISIFLEKKCIFVVCHHNWNTEEDMNLGRHW